jgi:hypothetical protein
VPDRSTTSHPLITRDPVTGDELLVTRLESPTSGVVIEGRFHLGWVGRLSPPQLEFVRLLALHRGNIQKVAGDLAIAYNTARTRSDEIAAALGTPGEAADGAAASAARLAILDQVAAGALSVEEALRRLRDGGRG